MTIKVTFTADELRGLAITAAANKVGIPADQLQYEPSPYFGPITVVFEEPDPEAA